MATEGLVSLDLWTFIATIINLFIQIWLLKKFLFKPVHKVLEERKKLADQQIEDAKAAKAEADSIKAEYEKNMANATAKAAQIVTDAQKQAQKRADQIVQQAEAEASSMKAEAAADIAQEKKKAVNEVKDQIGGLAMDIAGKVVEKEIDPNDHRKLIDEFIDKVGEAS